jgi:murein DD-endopeptidase MepM/ murein hydrolase activator NlpD
VQRENQHIMKRKKLKIALCSIVALLVIIMLLPTKIQNPVEGCGRESYNQKSFWHPWGNHRHAGIDIFAKKGTKVHPAIGGIVVGTARNLGAGGNCILILSSGWRLHYYAHLSEIDTHIGAIVTKNSVIGKVGNTGNAAGKPHHLHYSISSIIPQGDWRWQPKQILFYINPIKELEK